MNLLQFDEMGIACNDVLRLCFKSTLNGDIQCGQIFILDKGRSPNVRILRLIVGVHSEEGRGSELWYAGLINGVIMTHRYDSIRISPTGSAWTGN